MEGNGIRCYGNRIYRNQLLPVTDGIFPLRQNRTAHSNIRDKRAVAVIMLLCKIYTDGYYIPWGKEQCMIFARKLGPEYDKETMGDIVNMLVEKEFFDKESYEKYEILTSTEIQKVWMEATSRRKRDLAKLPYLLIECTDSKSNNKNNSKNECKKLDDADNMQTEMKLNTENADSVRQKRS